MAANKAGKGSKRRGFLQKMQFSKTKFVTKADVKKYLKDNDINTTSPVTDGDDVWIVKSDEDATQFKLGKAAATPGLDDGVTAFISPIVSAKADEEDDAEDENEDDEEDGDDEESDDDEEESDDDEEDEDEKPVKKGAASKVKVVDGKKTTKGVKRKPASKSNDDEQDDPVLDLPPQLAAKFDWWGAYVSGDQTLSGVLKDGSYDGMPPGLETVMMAASYTIGNILTSDDDDADKETALKQVGNEMAEFAFGLYGIFAKANEDTTKSVNKSVRVGAAKYVESFSASVASATKDGTFDNVIEEDEEDEDKAPAKPSKKSAAKPKAKTVKTDDDDDDTASLTLKAIADVAKAVQGVSKRLETVESRGSSRKSMSESIEDIVGDEDEEDEEEEAIRVSRAADLRSSMGLPRASAPRSNA